MADNLPHPLLKKADIDNLPEKQIVHQYNSNAVRHTRSLTDLLGLQHIGVHLVRVEPGRDTTTFHTHHYDEEFVYILEGKGIARIGDAEHEVHAGDFMGFTRKSLPHSMSNPFEEDLVYLMGGDRAEVDVCDYPDLNRRQYRLSGNRQYVDMDQIHDVSQR